MDRLKQQSNFQLKNYYIFMLLIVLCAGFGLVSPQFFTVSNWSNLLLVQATTGVMALGAIFVLILGEFDVSLGYLISFCMMTGAVLAERGAAPNAASLKNVSFTPYVRARPALFPQCEEIALIVIGGNPVSIRKIRRIDDTVGNIFSVRGKQFLSV